MVAAVSEIPVEHDTLETSKADPVRVVETKLDQLIALVRGNADASLRAHEEHRKAFGELREELDDLRGKVERGSPSSPPLTAVAREAHVRASNAQAELPALEGRTLAAVSELATKVATIEEKTDAQTALLTTIAGAVTTVTRSELARRVAKAAGLLFLGWALSKGVHL